MTGRSNATHINATKVPLTSLPHIFCLDRSCSFSSNTAAPRRRRKPPAKYLRQHSTIKSNGKQMHNLPVKNPQSHYLVLLPISPENSPVLWSLQNVWQWLLSASLPWLLLIMIIMILPLSPCALVCMLHPPVLSCSDRKLFEARTVFAWCA